MEIETVEPAGVNLAGQITAALSSYRDAMREMPGEVMPWKPPLASADAAILRDAGKLRARARDLVRNNAFAKNAVRMNRDAVTGSGLKLALKIDWRTLGLRDIVEAAEWQDHVTRLWEAHAESTEFQMDARRQLTFSQLVSVADQADYVDGESLTVVEMKPGISAYQTCLNLIDVDRLCNPDFAADNEALRGGILRDQFGEPLIYYIREGHPSDINFSGRHLRWNPVPRATEWGRPIVLHSFDQTRPEQTRGVSEFASAITPMRMLAQYNDTELQSAIVQATYAAVIKTEMDWTQAMTVAGATNINAGTGNKIVDTVSAYLTEAAGYHRDRNIEWRGAKIPHLLPNESLDVIKSTHPNANFADFESAFIRQLAAGLGVEAHEMGKNYREVNYSAARAALLAVWRTYRARRNRIINQIAMPAFGAWLEEAVAIGAVYLPRGVSDFFAAKPYLVKGTFFAWGKPMIDPLKERQAQNLSLQMGVETLEDVCAEEGRNYRDVLEQRAAERNLMLQLGLDPDADGPEMGGMAPAADPNAPANQNTEEVDA